MYRVLNVPSVSRIERRFLSVACPFLLVWPGTQHILLGTFHGGGKSVCGRNYTLWSDSYLCQINRAKHVLNKNLLNVIEALVFSKLYYCSSLWSNTSCSNISRLQGVQDFAARVLSNRGKFDHITPTLKELRWFPVKSHLFCRDAVLAFKCMNDWAPAYLSSIFKTRGEVSGRDTRSNTQLGVPLYRSAAGQRTFHYRTVTLWNNINPDVKLCKSLPNSKMKLKRELLKQFLES